MNRLNAVIGAYVHRSGLTLGVAAVFDSIDVIPEERRPYYVEKEDKKFHFDPSKLPDEDIAGPKYKAAIARHEKDAKEARDQAKAIAEKFKDVDPDKYREVMANIEQNDDMKLLAAGKGEEVFARREQKSREQHARDLKKLTDEKAKVETELKAQLSARDQVALQGAVASALGATQGYANAAKAAFLLAQQDGWRIDSDGVPTQFDSEGRPIIGKDGKTKYTMKDYFEDNKTKESHSFMFPAQSSGGGAGGDRGGSGSGVKTMPRTAFDRLSPGEQAKAAKDYKIVD